MRRGGAGRLTPGLIYNHCVLYYSTVYSYESCQQGPRPILASRARARTRAEKELTWRRHYSAFCASAALAATAAGIRTERWHYSRVVAHRQLTGLAC